jgi:hypothetical protein
MGVASRPLPSRGWRVSSLHLKNIKIRPLELSLFLFSGSLLIASVYTLSAHFELHTPTFGRLLWGLSTFASLLEIALRFGSCAFMFLYFKKTGEKFALAFTVSILLYSMANLIVYFWPVSPF